MLRERKIQLTILGLGLLVGFSVLQSSGEQKMQPTLSPPKSTAMKAADASFGPVSTSPSSPFSETSSVPAKRITSYLHRLSESLSQPAAPLPADLLDTSWITPQDRTNLSATALNHQSQGNTRRAAVFLLKKIGISAAQELTQIAMAPMPQAKSADPHSISAYENKLELELRISAVEGLDALSVQHPQVVQLLEKISVDQKDSTLKFMANISLGGIKDGKPGKLGRFMNAIIAEARM